MTVLVWALKNWRMVAVGFAVMAALACLAIMRQDAYRAGELRERGKWQAAEAERIKKQAIADAEARRKAAQIEAEYAAKQQEQKIEYRTITREVVRYAKRDDSGCALDADWLRIHNAAAAGHSIASASAASGVAADTGYGK